VKIKLKGLNENMIALAFFHVVAINLKSFHVAGTKLIFFLKRKNPENDFFCLLSYLTKYALKIFLLFKKCQERKIIFYGKMEDTLTYIATAIGYNMPY